MVATIYSVDGTIPRLWKAPLAQTHNDITRLEVNFYQSAQCRFRAIAHRADKSSVASYGFCKWTIEARAGAFGCG